MLGNVYVPQRIHNPNKGKIGVVFFTAAHIMRVFELIITCC